MGEVAQTVGLLTLLQENFPRVKLTLWASFLDHGVGEWLATIFPKVSLITGTVGRDGLPDQPALLAEWKRCQFLLHGPAGSVVARGHLAAWSKNTGKPFGIYGVTLGSVNTSLRSLLMKASFVLLRDGVSRAEALRLGLPPERIGFVPDAAFAHAEHAKRKALAWLRRHGLASRSFICLVPKLRHTPYWAIYGRQPKYAEINHAAINSSTVVNDHQVLVDALVWVMQRFPIKVLLCPEMPYQIQLGRNQIQQKLPASYRDRCIVREESFLPDEASSIFQQARLVVSMELLSAVVAASANTPAVHLRLPGDTNQGQMWRDVGLGEWLIERSTNTTQELATRILEVLQDPDASTAKLESAHKFIHTCESGAMALVERFANNANNATH